MWQSLKDLLASKKAIAGIAGAVMILVGRLGLDIDSELVTQFVSLVVAYIVGQGIADHGKEGAKIEAQLWAEQREKIAR
jgi:hypothetical protein